MKEFILEEAFPISVTQFFNLFFESKEFKINYHTLRGDSDVDISDWRESDEGEGYTRIINFSSPISSNALIQKVAGGMNARCKETQTYNFVGGNTNNEFHVKSLTTFDGSTLGKSFFSSTEWQVKSSHPPPLSSPVIIKSSTYPSLSRSYCNVKIIVKNEYKGRMFKGNIEGFVDDVARKSFTQWLDLVRNKLQELEKKKILPIVPNNEDTAEKKPFQQHQAAKTVPPTATSTTQHQRHHHHHTEKRKENLSADKSPFTPFYNLELPPTPKKEKAGSISFDDEDFSDSDSDLSGDTFYDAPDGWIYTGPNIGTYPTSSTTTTSSTQYIPEGTPDYLNNFIININNEVNQLKSAIEVNHTRLVGLESVYAQHQRDSGNGGPEGHSTAHTSEQAIKSEASGGLLGTCLQRVDNLIKLQQTEQVQAQERETYWKKKYDEMEEKVEKMKPSNSRSLFPRSPLGLLGLTVFLVLWPIVITKAWKFISPFKEVLLRKLRHTLGV